MNADSKRQALREAAQWFARMCASPKDATVQQQWQAWHGERPEHQWAWQRVAALQTQIGKVPQQLGWQVMEQVGLQGTGMSRRNLLGGLIVGAGLSGLGWKGWQSAPRWMADLQTGIGEQRGQRLSDGTDLVLDTASGVDIEFGPQLRLVTLRAGSVHVITGKDPRPFIVRSAQGEMRALGTRFAVTQLEGQTRLNVYQHAVAVRIDQHAGETEVNSGHQVTFSRQGISAPHALNADEESWASGRLTVDNWTLGQVVSELQRYRAGYLGYAPEVSQLRVSGTYPLDDIDVALDALAFSSPVRVQRYTRLWTRVVMA